MHEKFFTGIFIKSDISFFRMTFHSKSFNARILKSADQCDAEFKLN